MIRRFNRYELKYVLPWAKCEALIADLAPHIPVDCNGGRAGYRVVSLYYDSPTYDFFWAKVEGIRYRRKLRLRAYVDRNVEDITQCTVEIKQRINRTVQKRRLLLPLPEAERLCAGAYVPSGLHPLDQRVADEVSYLVRGKHLRPAAITAYHRRAFEGMHTNAGVRVTFDTDVRGRVHALKLDESAENQHIVPPGWAIMEVKANDGVPSWMISLLGRHECQLRRVSKYCLALAT
ncbi:MAG TPA: polyphosphate polymerase domain-containing protein, partial [Polyangiaceae bacterium]|nr:polyphosphate polymerase domain-containing protein [Polyangiaceae bacterium]